MANLHLEDLHKLHPGGAVALRGLELHVADAELVVLVGPSGCGKTTALRLVAGLDAPTRGRVWIDGRDVTRLEPRQRDLAMVFQSYALYPHKTVRENLGFGLRMRGVASAERARRVEAVARSLGLEALLERRPAQLSGGQRQRVALGRAIVREPKAFLLDEPLSNLDARLRAETRAELALLHRRLAATMLYVTHDQEEAMTLGDRIVVLRDGAVQQAGTPDQVYQRPANVFVAGFVGSPAMNLLPCRVAEGRPGARLRGPGLELPMPPGIDGLEPGRPLHVGIRPTDLEPAASQTGALLLGVELVEPLGSVVLARGRLQGTGSGSDGERLAVLLDARRRPAPGDRVALHAPVDRLHCFDAESGDRVN